ncbi:hypothetical protein B7463_g7576, partial [Scytalidium lignicola]
MDTEPNTFTLELFRGTTEEKIVIEKITSTLGDGEIYIETTHSGLCGTDIHAFNGGKILGHEGVGIVRQVGSDQYCSHRINFSNNNDNLGSLSSGVIWPANMVFPIPDGYESADAAPMLCAGATVFTILSEFGVRPTDRVGVIGIGGLGHLAIKFAAAMGSEVVALSSSESKQQEALEFGANEFHVFDSEKSLPPSFKRLNHLLLCTSVPIKNFNNLINLMDIKGTVYPLTVSFDAIPIQLAGLIPSGVHIQGTLTASRHNIRRMLKFTTLHNIKPTIMRFPMTVNGVKDAIDTLQSGKMRYRGVLVR